MAISNCLFSPTSENPRGFSVWCVLAKLSANPRNYSYPRPLLNPLKPTMNITNKDKFASEFINRHATRKFS